MKAFIINKIKFYEFLFIYFIGIIGILYFKANNFTPYLLYTIYLIFTLFYTYIRKIDISNPKDIYFILTLIGFGFGYPYFYRNPHELFFFNETAYNIHFVFNTKYLDYSFIIFLISSISFYLGSSFTFKTPSFNIKFLKIGYKSATIFTSLFIILFSIFRIHFKINLPGYNEVAFPHVGFIYNPGIYIINILIVYTAYIGIKSNSRSILIISLIPSVLYGLSLGLIGIKSGLIYNFLMIIVLFYLLRLQGFKLNRKLINSLKYISLISIILIYFIYSIIGYYRLVLMVNNFDIFQINFGGFFSGFFSYITEVKDLNSDSSSFSILKRVSGINYLVPIISFYDQNIHTQNISVFNNVIDVYSINPENYLTNTILGVPKETISTNAPGGIGALYIYGGLVSSSVGMLLLGLIFNNIYKFIIKNIQKSEYLIIIYCVLLIQIFVPVIIEGTIINFLKINIPSLIIGSILVLYIIKIMNFFEKISILKI